MFTFSFLFFRGLDDLEQTGYPASSLLSEALLRTFHGKYFYFGFKMTGFQNSGEPLTLKHVLGSENSLCHSQLDCTSNFENSHTLAYQMLACSDAVYATVTDHMRVLVKLLRNQNQSKEIRSAGSKQSYKPFKETDFAKSCTYSLCNYRDSLGSCKTLSFGEDQESVRFSFEASTSQSFSVKQDSEKSVRQNSVMLERSLKFKDQEETVETLFVNHDSDSKSKEIFLAPSELDTKHWRGCVTFDSFIDESCVSLVETCNKLVCTPLDSNCSIKQNFGRDCSFASAISYAYGNYTNTFNDLSIMHRLDFNKTEESNGLITSKRVDDELKRRECLSAHKNLSCKAMNKPVSCMEDNSIMCGSIVDTKHSQCGPASEDLKYISKESTAVDEAKYTRKSAEKERPILLHTFPKRKHSVLNEIHMPVSEGLDAFFESQFDDMEFTKEVTNIVSCKSEENENEQMFKQHGNLVNLKEEKYTGDIAKIEKSGIVEADENKNGLEKGLYTSSQAEYGKKNNLHDDIRDFQYMPDSEDIGDFLDSFEDYFLEEKETFENHQETKDAEPLGKKIIACKKCPEISEKTNNSFSKIETTRKCSVREDIKNRKEITDSFQEYSLRASKARDQTRKNTIFGKVPEAELICELEENEPDDLEEFLDNISSNAMCSKEKEVENSCQINISSQPFNEYEQENHTLKLKEVSQTSLDTTENGKNDTSEFLHELSLISLDGVENSHVNLDRVDDHLHIENEGTKYDVQLNYKGDDGDLRIGGVENITIQNNDVKQSGEENSNFDNTADFEQTTKSECKPVLKLFPFMRDKNLINSVHATDKSVLSAEKEHFNTDNESGIGVEKCNQGVISTSCEVFTDVNNSLAGKLEIISEEACVTVNELKTMKDESSCVNYSGDLFEISRTESEMNSQCILTVCTPSLNSTAFSENLSLNEVIFEESLLGTSTPGLDECVLLDSQDESGTVKSGIQSNMFDHLGSKRKVKFDKRLRRVSSCRVMDIRMKLNDSPLNTVPQYTLKSCLKSLKEPNLNLVYMCTKAQKREHLEQNQAIDVSVRVNIVEGTDIYQALTNEKNNTEQNTECLDWSSDLFGESLITLTKENLTQPVQINKKMGQKTDSVRVEDDASEKKEVNLTSKECDGEDLWLNESSDSLVFEAVHNVDDMVVDKGMKQIPDTDDLNSAEGEANLIAESPESPDLFSSQSDTGVLLYDGKSTVIRQSESFKQTLKQINKQTPCPVKDSVWKDCKRQALKPLVVNTPDCGCSRFYSKQTTSSLNSENTSLFEKNYGIQNVPHKMEENISTIDSPDIFGDSRDDLDQNFVCDKNLVVKRSNFLCKKLLF